MGEQSSHYRCALWPTPVDDVSIDSDTVGNSTCEIRGRTFFLIIVLRRLTEADVDYEESQYLMSTRSDGVLRDVRCSALPTFEDETFECPHEGCPSLSEFKLVGTRKVNSFRAEGLKIAFDYLMFFEAYKKAS